MQAVPGEFYTHVAGRMELGGLNVCVDTNLFIAISNKEEDAEICKRIVRAIESRALSACMSTIVVTEMLVGFFQKGEVSEAEKFLTNAQYFYEILPVTLNIAQIAARIRAENKIKLPDAILLATAKCASSDFLLSKDHPLQKKDPIILSPQEFARKYWSNTHPQG